MSIWPTSEQFTGAGENSELLLEHEAAVDELEEEIRAERVALRFRNPTWFTTHIVL